MAFWCLACGQPIPHDDDRDVVACRCGSKSISTHQPADHELRRGDAMDILVRRPWQLTEHDVKLLRGLRIGFYRPDLTPDAVTYLDTRGIPIVNG